jgi:hypothetical protein
LASDRDPDGDFHYCRFGGAVLRAEALNEAWDVAIRIGRELMIADGCLLIEKKGCPRLFNHQSTISNHQFF